MSVVDKTQNVSTNCPRMERQASFVDNFKQYINPSQEGLLLCKLDILFAARNVLKMVWSPLNNLAACHCLNYYFWEILKVLKIHCDWIKYIEGWGRRIVTLHISLPKKFVLRQWLICSFQLLLLQNETWRQKVFLDEMELRTRWTSDKTQTTRKNVYVMYTGQPLTAAERTASTFCDNNNNN
jgi:hypothetical protein